MRNPFSLRKKLRQFVSNLAFYLESAAAFPKDILADWSRPSSRQKRSWRPQLESLEQRCLPTTVGISKIQDALEGSQNGMLRISRDDTNGSLTVGYQLNTSQSTAYYGSDFTIADFYPDTGYVYFIDGQSSVDVAVTMVNDTLPGYDKTVQIDLLPGGESYSLGSSNSVSINLTDDDPMPQVWLNTPVNATENGTTGHFYVHRTPTVGYLTVNFEIDASSTAINGTDFSSLPGTSYGYNTGQVTFNDGQATVDIEVAAYNDSQVESTENVKINLLPSSCGSGVYAVSTPSTQTLTIADYVNHAPTLTGGGAYTLLHGHSISNLNLLSGASDQDGDYLSVSLVTSPAHGYLYQDSYSGTWVFYADSNYAGADSFSYRAYDGQAYSSNTVTISFTITNTVPLPEMLASF